MDWRDEHRSNLEQTMEEAVRLLGNYEVCLINEGEPQARSKLKGQIAELKKQMRDCRSDLDSLEQDRGAQRSLALTMASVTYDDINFVISALLNQRMIPIDSQDYSQPTYPEQKMSKNDLMTSEVRFLLGMGLAKAGDVRHFIENNAKIHFPDVPERLKKALNAEYTKLVKAGLKGDELFMQLDRFSSYGSLDRSRQAAGLAVLCYFFETCDVFEP